MAYEFVEAFSSVVPQVRVSQIMAAIGVIVDVLWRVLTRNYFHPSFVDIVPAVLIGYYMGRRAKRPKSS